MKAVILNVKSYINVGGFSYGIFVDTDTAKLFGAWSLFGSCSVDSAEELSIGSIRRIIEDRFFYSEFPYYLVVNRV